MPRKSIRISQLKKSNTCRKKSSKLNRPGPPYSANECKHLGHKGNDNQLYYSLPNKNGMYRWVKWSTVKKQKWFSLSKGKYVFVRD
jgi:hypothetical protein